MKEGRPTPQKPQKVMPDAQTYQKAWPATAHGEDDIKQKRDVYGGGVDPTSMTNVGGSDGGARLTVAEGVDLREACRGNHRVPRQRRRGTRATSRSVGRSETEHDSGTSTYSRTYSDERRTENENA